MRTCACIVSYGLFNLTHTRIMYLNVIRACGSAAARLDDDEWLVLYYAHSKGKIINM